MVKEVPKDFFSETKKKEPSLKTKNNTNGREPHPTHPAFIDKNDSAHSKAVKVPTPPSSRQTKIRRDPAQTPFRVPYLRKGRSPPLTRRKKKRSRSLTPLKILPCHPLQNQVSHLRSRTVPRVTNFRVATPHFRRPIEGLSKQATQRRYKTHILPIHSRSRVIRQSKISLAKQPHPLARSTQTKTTNKLGLGAEKRTRIPENFRGPVS